MTWGTVATAAAIGASVGAGSAVIQGKEGDEILESALIGGATGALTGGVGSEIGTELGKEVGKEALKEGASTVTQEALKEGTATVAKEGVKEAALQEGIKAGATDTIANVAPQAVQENAINQGILQAGATPAGAIPPPPAGSTPLIPAGANPAGVEQIGTQGFSPDVINAVNQGNADSLAAYGTGTQVAGPAQLVNAPVSGPSSTSMTQSELADMASAETGRLPLVSEPVGTVPDTFSGSSDLISEPTTNPFLQGVKDVGSWMNANKGYTAAGAYLGLQSMGAFNQNSVSRSPEAKRQFNNPYRLSPDFQGGPYSQPNVYKPKTYNYASGGITSLQGGGGPVERMSQMNTAMNPQGGMYPMGMIDKTQYATPTQRPVSAEMVSAAPAYERSNPMLMASGGIARFSNGEEVEERPTRRYRGDLMGTLDKYNEMIGGSKKMSGPPATDVGIVVDDDMETRSQPADVAAITRLKKRANQANFGLAAFPTPVRAGALNLPTKQSASGGIMQASLGGYAAGGNPRLLRGPGDGMSDNIPATIGGKQPARLADGEFVVPADVVSHLGNGSTDAGAKRLHEMMNQVRMDRTGKKKQAPAVKAKKYIPK
jgi:hypothetical protein